MSRFLHDGAYRFDGYCECYDELKDAEANQDYHESDERDIFFEEVVDEIDPFFYEGPEEYEVDPHEQLDRMLNDTFDYDGL